MKRGLLLIILIAGLVAGLRPMERSGSFQKLNQKWISWLSANTKEAAASPSITFLQLDEKDWPTWPPGPLDYATIFYNLKTYSPPVVAVEPVFDWENPQSQAVSSLASNTGEFPTLLLAIGLQENPAEADFHDPALASNFEVLQNVTGDVSKVPQFTGIHTFPPESVRRTNHLGHTYIDLGTGEATDQDVVRVPLLARYGDQVIPSFVLQAVLLKEHLPLSLVTVNLGEAIHAGKSLSIPIDESGHLAVSPDWKHKIPTLSADVLLAGPDPDPSLLKEGESVAAVESLRNNLVLIGTTGNGVRTFDRPGGGKITRAEKFAAAIATIQSRSFAVRLSENIQYAVWGATALFALLTIAVAKSRASAVTAAALGIFAIIIVGLLTFQSNRHWCPPAIPAAIVALGAAFAFLSPRPNPPAQDSEVA